MHKLLETRERTGKPSKPKDVCYICISSTLAPYGTEIINKTFSGHENGCFVKSPKAETVFNNAKSLALQAMKNELKKKTSTSWKKILNKEALSKTIDELDTSDFKKSIFLIFTMEGKAEAINDLISKEKKDYAKLGSLILSVEDHTGELQLDRNTNAIESSARRGFYGGT